MHRQNLNNYFGMELDYRNQVMLNVSMLIHLGSVLQEFSQNLGATAATPYTDPLFKVLYDIKTQYLAQYQSQTFRHKVPQLLCTSYGSHRDIQTVVEFLVTCVNKPYKDYWGELKCVLEYLKGTQNPDISLIIGDISVVKWWFNAPYAAHEDLQSHMTVIMSLGKLQVFNLSKKQKINVNSPTEDEMIGVNKSIAKILWSK